MASKRLRQILKVFSSVGLLSYREKKVPLDRQSTPVRLRQAFEQLGPSFVKIGQILSTRSDLLPEVYIRELSKLQSSVPPLDQEEVMRVIQKELASQTASPIIDLSPQPLASGSVAQTHLARLTDGHQVIVKVQRPGIDHLVEEDIDLLLKLARRVPKQWIPMVDLQEVLENLRETLIKELDFRHEASAMERFASYNATIKCLAVPKVYPSYTTRHLLVEEYIEGIPVNHYQKLIAAGYDLEDIGKKLMLSFIKQVFKDGYFHGDPHPGNLLIRDGQLVFIDFGIMGELDPGMRSALNDILYSFTAQDIDGMTKAILSVTQFDNSLNRAVLSQDVEQMLGRYSGMDLGNLAITDLLEDLLAVFQKNHLKASSQITILEKAALQIEGIFRELAPDIDLMTLAKDYFLENMGPDMLKQALNKESLLIELFYLIRNGKNIPRRLHQLLEQVLNGRIVLNHDVIAFDSRLRRLEALVNNLVLTLMGLALLLTGAILSLSASVSLLSQIFLGAGSLLMIVVLCRMCFKKKSK